MSGRIYEKVLAAWEPSAGVRSRASARDSLATGFGHQTHILYLLLLSPNRQ